MELQVKAERCLSFELPALIRSPLILHLSFACYNNASHSDLRPQIERVVIKKDLTKGDVQVLQTAEYGKPSKCYDLPPPQSDGPCFSSADIIPGTF